MSILINILLVFHVLVSLLIILSVLMQRPKNEGLGAAFGGGMTDNLFGAQTTNVLQTFTRWLGGIFFVLTIFLSFLYVRQTSAKSDVQRRLALPTTPPAAPAAPATAPLDSAASQPRPAGPEAASAPVKADGAPGATAPAASAPGTPAPGTPAPGTSAPTPADSPSPAPASEPVNPAPAPAPAEGASPTPVNPAPSPTVPPAPAPAAPTGSSDPIPGQPTK